jgi:hypothetical protein
VSLNGDAPLPCQFMLQDHPVRHSRLSVPPASLCRGG